MLKMNHDLKITDFCAQKLRPMNCWHAFIFHGHFFKFVVNCKKINHVFFDELKNCILCNKNGAFLAREMKKRSKSCCFL